MKVYIDGHECKTPLREIIHAYTNINDIQFCPLHEERQGNWVYSRLEHDGNAVLVTTEICYNNNIYKDKRSISNYTTNLETNAVKAGYYLLAREVYGFDLPWGAHTGIRPARIAADFISKGIEPKNALSEKYFISPQKAELATQCAKNGMEIIKNATANGISLYVGIPFCPSRCLYCSFISTPIKNFEKQIKPYLEFLIKEIAHTGWLVKQLGFNIDTVYIGGGTPTILDTDSLNRLIQALYFSFDLSHILEFTVEAGRPDTITQEKLSTLKSLGVSRISINPQTLNDSVLETVGRKHNSAQFATAFEMARNIGFDNINTDMIAGLPTESEEMFISSLEKLLKYNPDSITLHTMCIKKAARLNEESPNYTTNNLSPTYKMVDYAYNLLSHADYAPYYMYRQKDTLDNLENTGYSRPNKHGLYNILMMDDLQSIISLGAGGVTKLVRGKRIERLFNFKDPVEYIRRFDEILYRKNNIEPTLRQMEE